jgi:serine/threonine protein phosphatase PrpC
VNQGDEHSAGATAAGSDEEETRRLPAAGPRTGGKNGALAQGDRIGPYVIERALYAASDEGHFLARTVSDEGTSYVTLIARQRGGFAALERVVALNLRHPRLLAPRVVLTHGDRDVLVLDALAAPDGTASITAGQGARLDPASALRAGTGLADALSYLHRSEVAHLHLSPDALAVFDGRAFLAGMEMAEYVGGAASDPTPLFARDANFLARSLGVLAGLEPDRAADESDAVENLRRIVAHGESDGFTSPADLAAACSAALDTATQMLPLPTAETLAAPLHLDYGTATTIGRVRSQNQDACAAVLFDIRDDHADDLPLAVFLVADGMGGEAHGELASRIATRILPVELVRSLALPAIARPALAAASTPTEANNRGESKPEQPALTDALARAVEAANRQVRELAHSLGQATGTTLTAVAISGQRAALAHLGDSRAYLLRGDVMVQLTEDHSVLARLQSVDHPLLSDPDIFVPRSMLYRSLGQEDEIGADTLDFTVAPGDRLLLCSDGLWDEVDSQEIAQALAGASEPVACADRLVALANAAGGHDNSTAVVVFVRAATPDETERAPAASEDGDDVEVGSVPATHEVVGNAQEGSGEEQP